MNANLTEIEKLIAQDNSIRDIAKKTNIPKSTIWRILKANNLKTTYALFKAISKPKISLPIAYQITNDSIAIDISDITIKPQHGKHERKTGYQLFLAIINNKKYAVISQTNHNKVYIFQILKQIMDIAKANNIKTIYSDKEFSYLREFGFNVYKLAQWNCSKQPNEKVFGGIKTKVYPILRRLKHDLGLNDKELMTTYKDLVLRVYITILKRHGFYVINKINQEVDICQNQYVMAICH